jgi:hypothetical protein
MGGVSRVRRASGLPSIADILPRCRELRVWAKRRLSRRSKRHLYSTTQSARPSSVHADSADLWPSHSFTEVKPPCHNVGSL